MKVDSQYLQTLMWKQFNRGEEGLANLTETLMFGANPDKSAYPRDGGFVPTLLNMSLHAGHPMRDDMTNMQTIKLSFAHGADLKFNRRNLKGFDAVMHYQQSRSVATLLAEMAVYDLEHYGSFTLPINDSFINQRATISDSNITTWEKEWPVKYY